MTFTISLSFLLSTVGGTVGSSAVVVGVTVVVTVAKVVVGIFVVIGTNVSVVGSAKVVVDCGKTAVVSGGLVSVDVEYARVGEIVVSSELSVLSEQEINSMRSATPTARCPIFLNFVIVVFLSKGVVYR